MLDPLLGEVGDGFVGPERAELGTQSSRNGQSDVRAWARDQGIQISNRGRIPADVLAKYNAAH